MKKIYEKPELEIIKLLNNDIITDSGDDCDEYSCENELPEF